MRRRYGHEPAIAGAVLGAAWGLPAVPAQWLDSILNCRPQKGRANVHQPGLRNIGPVDILKLAEKLLGSTVSPS